ncbi:hypothetical protein TNCV_73451 [Trichonephila clavipes]|nr:hypothetical protein TNCV_73451 [Trichonephila clavipes]
MSGLGTKRDRDKGRKWEPDAAKRNRKAERVASNQVSRRLCSGSFAMCEKGGNNLVLGSDYMVDALKLPNQAPRGYGESLQKYVLWRCPDGTQYLFCWPFLVNR